jgi:hypothetical protein
MNKEKIMTPKKDPYARSYYRQVRMRLVRDTVQRLEELRDEREFPNFTALVNKVLADYLLTQELKQEFALINNNKCQ